MKESNDGLNNGIIRAGAARWDEVVDVIVLGYGGTGAVAAVTASDMGGKVMILEKAPEPGGTTSVSTGAMRIPQNAEKAAEYIKAVGLGTVDEETAGSFTTERFPGSPRFITYNLARELYTWSPDNQREIEKGWISKGDSIEQLAARVGIDPQGLESTVSQYNEFCSLGPYVHILKKRLAVFSKFQSEHNVEVT